MRIHCGTKILTTFASIDPEGNLVEGTPLEVQVGEFSIEAFQEAFEKLAQERSRQEEQISSLPTKIDGEEEPKG